MSEVASVEDAMAYAEGLLSSEIDWEAVKPSNECPASHCNNDDRDALRFLCTEIQRLRETNSTLATENDVLTRAAATMGGKLEKSLADNAEYKSLANQLGSCAQQLLSEFKQLQLWARQWKTLALWHEERDELVQAALKLLNSYTTHKAVAQWERDNPKPIFPV